ncbi:MAG: TIGR01777 family protein [Gammaproteobacteria bacterium]|nr:MAG: TIGR01777 family protein [Gammaproteobacteria bacterium]
MNILITGASGLIGSAVNQLLQTSGHRVFTMSRKDTHAAFYWRETAPRQWRIDWDEDTTIDAVIHLAGESVGNKRWSTIKKQRICRSRIDTTKALVEKLGQLQHKPEVLISASAIGFYGDNGEEEVTEDSPAGNDFFATLAQNWEQEANRAAQHGVRVVNLRTGLVLSKHGGALPSMLPPFKLGLGGRLGNGRQWMSWISDTDIARLIVFLLENPKAQGPVNAVNAAPVRNAEFTVQLASAVCRPALMHMPKLVVKLLFGEMGDLLLLSSIKVKPARAQQLGFEFEDTELNNTLVQRVSED